MEQERRQGDRLKTHACFRFRQFSTPPHPAFGHLRDGDQGGARSRRRPVSYGSERKRRQAAAVQSFALTLILSAG